MPIDFKPDPQAKARQDILAVFDPQDSPIDFKPAAPAQAKIDFKPAAPAQAKIDFKPAAPVKNEDPPSKAGSFLGDLASSIKNRFISKPLEDTKDYIKQNAEEGIDTAVYPSETKVPNQEGSFAQAKLGVPKPDKPDVSAPLLTNLKRPLGVAQTVTSPLFSLERGYISKPIEEATGGKIKADWVDFARMFTPMGVASAAGLATRAKEALIPESAEKITASAIKDKDRVITGANHDEAYAMAGKDRKKVTLPEGFVTNKGRFIDRKAGLALAQKNGQAPATLLKPGELHSEDVAKAMGLPPEKGIPQKEPNDLQKGAKAIEKIFSPTTLSGDAKKAEGIVRASRGEAERRTLQAQAQINDISKEINALPPEEQAKFVNYIETRSKGTKLENPGLQKAADTIRGVYQKMRTALENTQETEKMGFVQDYFVHQWKDAKKAQAFIQDWTSKYGSGTSTNKRTLPTIEEGIKAGLTPKHTNPLDATMHYVADMNNFLALKDIQRGLKEQGLRKFFPEGRQPPGWVKLRGPGNRVLYTAEDAEKEESVRAGINAAYAPEDAARIYNRYYDAGYQNEAGDLYRVARAALNGPTQMLLGFSGYHYRLIANEATAAAFSRGMQALSKGRIKDAGGEVLKGTPYAGPITQAFRGKGIERQFLGTNSGYNEKIIDTLTRAGARMSGMDKTLKNSESNNFWEAWKKGTLKTDFKASFSSIGGFARGIGKLMDTQAYPLFAKTIPWIKNAANYDGLADWIKAHPGASEEEVLAAARDIVDSTDNTFGEMIQDNLFWPKMVKQAAQLIVLSIGWDLGNARQIGGGMKDLSQYVSGKGELTPRAAYLIGAPISHMLNAAVYQYIKTGQWPQVPQDLVYPRTAGEVTESPGTKYEKKVPERAVQPSIMKDVIGFQEHPVQELENKMLPVWKIVGDMVTNSDWRGDNISYQYMQNAPSGLKAYADYVIKSLSPISVTSIAKRQRGTNIGILEHLSGVNPTGMQGRDPEGYRAMLKNLEMKKEEKSYSDMLRDQGITPPKKPHRKGEQNENTGN